MQLLHREFYQRNNVVQIAQELIGKLLITKFDGVITSGRIVETEAYAGKTDKASHAYNGRRTNRNTMMYYDGGVSYIYICYGMHTLFNVVTNTSDVPDAVLIRGIEPMDGLTIMLERCKKSTPHPTIGRGPGNSGKALGFHLYHNGLPLSGKEIGIYDDAFPVKSIHSSKRIGVDYAGDDANLPYRFFIPGHLQVTQHANNKSAKAAALTV